MPARVLVRYLSGEIREELAYIDPDVDDGAVYCPSGFRIEFGPGGEYTVCRDAFRIRRRGDRILLEEIGYYRERIA